ncbi:MAG: hypothetical protein R3A52_22665 [Polyangiales bacterium]
MQTWQLLAGLTSPLLKQVPPMRRKPSSTRPSQSSSTPLQTRSGAPAVALQVVPVPLELQTRVPVRQAPTPTVHDPPAPATLAAVHADREVGAGRRRRGAVDADVDCGRPGDRAVVVHARIDWLSAKVRRVEAAPVPPMPQATVAAACAHFEAQRRSAMS